MTALTASDIAALSRLLDEAQAVAAPVRDAWLAALPPGQAHLAAALREMLAAEGRPGTESGPLSTLPRLGSDAAAARAGEQVGPYRLLRELGRGGMGSVWLAERADGVFERQVALKLPRLTWDEGLSERMAREQRIGARLEHPHIARLYDAGLDAQGRPYIAMQFVDGVPIDAFVRERRLDTRATLALMVQVVRAVGYAHGRLVIHRDLKPGNVLVDAAGQAHLLDFGIAKLQQDDDARLTQERGRVMTLHYAAPEQIAGQEVSVQADVYSLGVLLYELLTGTLPHGSRRRTAGAIEDAILDGDAPLASSRVQDKARAKALRGEVDAILAKAMRRDPRQRYATAEALADDIERHLAGETVSARPDSLGYRTRKLLRRHWMGFGATAAVVVAVIAGTAVALLQAQRAARAAERQRMVTEFVADVFRVDHRAPLSATSGPVGDAFLRQGAQLVSQKFAGEPAMQAQMYGVIAEMFLDLGIAEQAADYAARRVDALNSAPPDNGALFEAVLAHAVALFAAGQFADAELQGRRAVPLAGSDPERQLRALAQLARTLAARGNIADGLRTTEQIAAAAKALGRPTVAEAWGPATRGALLSKDNRYPESGPWLEKGIALARQVEGPDSAAAAQMMRTRGSMMVIHREGEPARKMLLEAYEMDRRRGPRHAARADVQQASQWARMFELRFVGHDEARQAADRALETMARTPTIPDRTRCQAGFERGDVAFTWGDLEDALHWMAPNAECLLARSPNGAASTFWVAREMAFLLITRGDHRDAERWVRQRYLARKASGETRHPWSIWDSITEAMNLSMSGRGVEARALLDAAQAPPEFPHRVAPIMSPGEALRVARARVLADAGQTDAAWQLVHDRPHAPGQDEPDWSSVVPLYGELQCRRGQHAEGRELLEQAIRVSGQERWVHRAELAWMRGLAGLCALGMNDRAGALKLAREARETFTARPRVSDYYKAPWLRLEQALGLRLPAV